MARKKLPAGSVTAPPIAKTFKMPGVKTPKIKTPKVTKSQAPKPWYDPSQTALRDQSISGALADPLASITGDQALSFAKGLVASQTAPVLQDYDRQQHQLVGRGAAQQAANSSSSQTLQQILAGQLAAQSTAQDKARGQIQSAGTQFSESVDAGAKQAANLAAQSADVRGGGLDGGAAAKLAQDQANAKARGQAGSQIALDAQAGSAQSGNQLLQQIMAASAQQGGERAGAITSQTNSGIRDMNEGRSKALAGAQGDFLKTIMDLRGNNQQIELAKQGILGDQAKVESDAATAAAKQKSDAQLAALKLKVQTTEGAANRKAKADLATFQAQVTAAQKAADRKVKTSEGAANRQTREEIADKNNAARNKPASPKTDKALGRERKRFDTYVLASPKLPGASISDSRRIAAKRKVTDPLMRQMLADIAHGGLRVDTIRIYRNKFGTSPPSQLPRYKTPAAPTGTVAPSPFAPPTLPSLSDYLKNTKK